MFKLTLFISATAAALLGFVSACGVATTLDASSCCACLMSTQTDGTTATPDTSGNATLPSNCIAGNGSFNDENVQCSEQGADQVTGGDVAITAEMESCLDDCADECADFSVQAV